MMYSYFDRNGRLDRSAMRRQVEACTRGGAHGIAVLGLATEINKLTEVERCQLVEWVIEDVGGTVPIAVTVSGTSVDAQANFANWAKQRGASWVILQPPAERAMPEAWYVDFFASVMDRTELPCAIQNAPEYIGVGLALESIKTLRDRCPNFTLLKGEGPALTIRHVIDAVAGEVAVFNGRGGLELLDNLRAGCAGVVPATDTFDYQVRAFELMLRGADRDQREAERVYEKILPAIVFTLQSLDTLICYGKRIAALRLGLPEVCDRPPALAPTDFGMVCARRYADMLGRLD